MDISSILPGPVGLKTNPNATSDDISGAAADFDSFLTLLTAQLRNQDPLSPLDSTEFVAQLASFSSVEQLVGANERLDALSSQSLAGDVAVFASWIGKDVTTVDGAFRSTGSPVSFTVPVRPGADRVEARITDLAGNPVANLAVTPDENGQATWDGLNNQGNVVAARDLSLQLRYFQNGELISEQAGQVLRKITGINGTQDGFVLELADGGAISPDVVASLR